MLLLETKDQLTLKELLHIAYEYGNNNADMPTSNESTDLEFENWYREIGNLIEKTKLL